jgi:microcystin degradation protein MlrC
MPGGPVDDDTFASLAGDLLDRLRRANAGHSRLAGVVFLLHGAMVTESDTDPEGTLLAHVREIVGPERPIAVALDSHANVTRRMVETADFIVSYRTYPHVDTRARGQEAMRACLDMIATGTRLVAAYRCLPLLMPLIAQSTAADGPLAPVLAQADALRAEPGVVSISIVPGFPFSDIPEAGGTVLAYTHAGSDARKLAESTAESLARTWWSLRTRFGIAATPLSDLPKTPLPGVTVLADIADNPGAGGSSDSTHLLRHAIANGWTDAAFATIADPLAVAACHAAGVGATIHLAIGGKATALSGDPVAANWTIGHLGDGVFVNEGAMAKGATSRIGRTATVRHAGISVILSERRAQALDPSVFRAGGIDPGRCRWLVVKSSVHYRASFTILATTMIDIECPGLSTSHLRALPYNRVTRPIAPLDDIARLPAGLSGDTLHA